MTFGEAICELEKGHAIRQSNWMAGKRIERQFNRNGNSVLLVIGALFRQSYKAIQSDYRATNWEIYKG